MTNILRAFIWKDVDQRFVPFLIFFTVQNLVIGLMFAFGMYIPGITELPLFTLLDKFLPAGISAIAWGIGLVVVFIGHCLAMTFRGRGWGPITAMTGFLLWCYALYLYSSIFYLMGIVAICAPNLFFWIWYYFEAKNYKRELRIVDAELNNE